MLDIKPGQEVEWYAMKSRAMLEAPRKIAEPVKFLTSQIKFDVDAVRMVREARKEFR